MELLEKLKEPVFLKAVSDQEQILHELEQLATVASGNVKRRIEQEIKRIQYGMIGERQIEFELRNSHIPMYVIPNLFLEYKGLTAQIDFLILTKRRYFVVECKNLYGNLVVTDRGDFIRTITQNGVLKKERIYSPITQNRRHMELIKDIRRAEQKNFITRALFEKNFYENYRSVVVFANPKGILNAKYAPKEIAEQIINADQLIEYIRKVNNEKDAVDSFEKDLKDMAQFFLQADKTNPAVYIEKFRRMVEQDEITEADDEILLPSDDIQTEGESTEISLQEADCLEPDSVPICERCGAPMVKRIAKKGDHQGNIFWGCSNYPKCRYIVNVTDNS